MIPEPNTHQCFFVTPLKDWSAGNGPITEGYSVKELDLTLLDLDSRSYYLSPNDLDELKKFRHWLWHECRSPFPRNLRAEAELLDSFDYALDAVQILAPKGSHGLVLMIGDYGGQLMLEASHHRFHRQEPIYGPYIDLSSDAPTDLALLIGKLHEACQQHRIIRILNPVRFLQHGLQAVEMHIRLMLFTTGIDGLLMASNQNQFCNRLENLLGANSFIFPQDRSCRQPKYRVGAIAADLYELRSQIAHGRPISKRFRELTGLLDTSGDLISIEFGRYHYRHVLEECSTFMLCQALKKVLTTNLLNDIAREDLWRERLKRPVS